MQYANDDIRMSNLVIVTGIVIDNTSRDLTRGFSQPVCLFSVSKWSRNICDSQQCREEREQSEGVSI